MKNKFSKKWIASKQPRKQRKFLANAPLHMRKKFVSVNLIKALREKHNLRNIPVKKGDTVKVLRGKFAKKQGKITEVNLKTSKVIIEGIQTTKQDGSKVNLKMQPSNLQIVELNLDDKKRFKGAVKPVKTGEKDLKEGKKPEENDLYPKGHEKVTSKINTEKVTK